MKGKFTEKFPRITGLRGDNGTFMEDGFGADGMNCGLERILADKLRQVRLLQREGMEVPAEVRFVRSGRTEVVTREYARLLC